MNPINVEGMLKTLIKPICELEPGDVLTTDHGYCRVHTVKQEDMRASYL